MGATTTLPTGEVRRVLALLAALAVLMLPVALPVAHAEPDYPPAFYKISASTYTARVGGTIAFTAQTFKPGSTVTFSVSSAGAKVSSASATANGKGVVASTLHFTVAGANVVSASGTSDQSEPLKLTTSVRVSAGAGDEGDADKGNGGNGNGNDGNGGNGGNEGSGSAPQADRASGVPFFGGGLPRTGGDVAVTALLGSALVALGAGLVIFGRRRRTS